MKTILNILLTKIQGMHTQLLLSEIPLKDFRKLSKSLQDIEDFINHILKQVQK